MLLPLLLAATAPSTSPPLLARWKRFEEFGSILHRARRIHDLLLRSLRAVWGANILEEGNKELARAMAGVANEEALIKAKTKIRAGVSIRFLEQDTGGRKLAKALTMTSPLQPFLNRSFAAEKVTTKLTDAIVQEPVGAVVESKHLQALRTEAVRENVKIFSGQHGHAVQRAYAEMVADWNCAHWAELGIPTKEKFDTCTQLFKGASSAYRRLVTYYEEQSRFRLMTATCETTEYSPARMAPLVESLLLKRDQCRRCVDTHYTTLWCGRLSSG